MKAQHDTFIVAILGFLFGALVFSSIMNGNMSFQSLTNAILAGSAALGINIWKKEHDYKSYQNDKSELLKLSAKLAVKGFQLTRECRMVYEMNIIACEQHDKIWGLDDEHKDFINKQLMDLSDAMSEMSTTTRSNVYLIDKPNLHNQVREIMKKSQNLVDHTITLKMAFTSNRVVLSKKDIESFKKEQQKIAETQEQIMRHYEKIMSSRDNKHNVDIKAK